MITYKGYQITEGEGVSGVKIYQALRSSANCIASNRSLLKLIQIIDEQEESNA
jgi:hypothetical protein